MKFEELNLKKEILTSLNDIGYTDTTKIQELAIPKILDGKDVIGLSKTGTGKTATFGLPIINKINIESKKTQSLIICPTRELSQQISQELEKFTKHLQDIKIVCVFGGQELKRQIIPLRKGAQIVVGTPGRIMDHIRRKTLKLDEINLVVLDEADEMLNMGFEEDIDTILSQIPNEIQTLLFSATMNKKILKITDKYLKEPITVKIKSESLTVKNIEELAINLKSKIKTEAVLRLLSKYNPSKAVIFCNTKRKVDEVVDTLKNSGKKVEGIHSDIRQEQRSRIMKKIKNHEIDILVATDVAARGLDIDEIELVINYDIPQDNEYYVHRIGRTGRNGKSGIAITFVVGKEKYRIEDIENFTKSKILYTDLPTVTDLNKIKNESMEEELSKIIAEKDFFDIEGFNNLSNNLNNDFESISKALFTYITRPKIIKNANTNPLTKIFLNAGKKDKIKVKDILGSINANAAIPKDAIGTVDLLDSYTFLKIKTEYVEELLDSMKGKAIKGKKVNFEISNN